MIVPVKTDTWNYDIVLEPGAIKKAGELLNLNRRVLVVTDSGVPAQYAETVAAQCGEAAIVTIPQGEQSKCFDELRHLLSEMLDKSFTRVDCVVAVGGVTETVICGTPAGVGEPWFDSVESIISHAAFSLGGVKGIEFGAGFAVADMRGSECNDPLRVSGGRIVTTTNNNGGVNGGITNGMPIVFRCAVKPTPSIAQQQDTVDFIKNENTQMSIHGRHDPAIIRRICPVLDSVAALCVADMLSLRYGTDVLTKGVDDR